MTKQIHAIYSNAGDKLYSCAANSMKECVEEAVIKGISLHNADFSNANLHNANLYNADLSKANLYNADLYNADLYKANLRGANLRGANLTNTNLANTNLANTDLTKANLATTDLAKANLHNCIGNGEELQTIQTPYYTVNITKDRIQIGCKNYSHEEWANFTDEQIADMDGYKATEFWGKYKEIIFQFITLNK